MTVTAVIRDYYVAIDTMNYYEDFVNATNSEYFTDKQSSQPVYAYITYFCRNHLNYDWYMLIWYSIIMFSVSHVILRSSVNCFLSLFIFIACGFYTNSFNVMRQFVATSIMFLSMYEFSKEQYSRLRIIFFTLLAVLIHGASLILLPILILKKLTIRKEIQSVLVIGSFILGFFLTSYLQPTFTLLSAYVGRFEGYLLFDGDGERNFISNFGVNIMFLYTLFLASNKTAQSIYFKAYFTSMILFNIFGSMYYLTRLTDFYAVAQIICIPLIIKETRNSVIKYSYFALLVAYSLFRFYIKGLNPFLPYEIRPDINFLIF